MMKIVITDWLLNLTPRMASYFFLVIAVGGSAIILSSFYLIDINALLYDEFLTVKERVIGIGVIIVFVHLILTYMIKRAFLKVSSVEKKFRSLYDNSPDLLRTINTEGIILDCNKQYAASFGYSKDEVIGKSIFAHTADDSLSQMNDSIESWKKSGKVWSREIWFKRKDGTTFPGLLSATNLYDDQGNLIGSNTVIKNLEDLYKARNAVLEEKTKRLSAVGQLASRISHDLRNPLSVIKNTVDLMKIRNPVDEKTKADLLRLDRAVMRMAHQVDEVLDYVSPKPLNIQSHSVRDILINTLERISNPPGVSIELSQNDVQLKCDYEKLEAVFVNLITNAIQAMNNIGQIYLRIKEESENVVVEVEDTGPGIPDDVLPKIFDPLFTTRQVGTGLGLVSCKAIVEKHNGTIDIHTRVGKGTIFIIRLPK